MDCWSTFDYTSFVVGTGSGDCKNISWRFSHTNVSDIGISGTLITLICCIISEAELSEVLGNSSDDPRVLRQ